ncbi:hypothetical protein [Saccharopolyspora tripterygii]
MKFLLPVGLEAESLTLPRPIVEIVAQMPSEMLEFQFPILIPDRHPFRARVEHITWK